jgi:crotonobetainyl-CoA:carnitine CoA-transferase CaiB-like acyl-CoA transferase
MSHDDPIGTLIERLCHTREELASELGVSPAALYSWSVGRRTPRQSNRSELARIARAHARELDELANVLDGRRAPVLTAEPASEMFAEQQRMRRQQLRELRSRLSDPRGSARDVARPLASARSGTG